MTGNAIEQPFLTAGCQLCQFMMTRASETALEYGREVLSPPQHRIHLIKGDRRRRVVRHLQDHRVPKNHVDHHHGCVGVLAASFFGEGSPDAWGDGGKFHAKLSMSSSDVAKEFLPGGGKFHCGCFSNSLQKWSGYLLWANSDHWQVGNVRYVAPMPSPRGEILRSTSMGMSRGCDSGGGAADVEAQGES